MLRSGCGGYYVAKTVEESLAMWHAWAGENASKERDGARGTGCTCAECQGRQGRVSVAWLKGAPGRLRPQTPTPNSGSKTEVREGNTEPKDKQQLQATCGRCVLHHQQM